MLLDRDWTCDSITAGIAAADMIATDPNGRTWCVEIKNCAGIIPAHKRQAIEQAKKRRLPWMLASKIAGSSSWLVQRQNAVPVVWHAKFSTANACSQESQAKENPESSAH